MAGEVLDFVPAVDHTARHGLAFMPKILGERVDKIRGSIGGVGVKIVKPFADIPSIVATPLNSIDFFKAVLADVSGPQMVGLGVKREPLVISEPVGPNLTTCILAMGKRIVIWIEITVGAEPHATTVVITVGLWNV